MSTSKLDPDWLRKSEQPIRSQVSKLTKLSTMTQTHKFPLQEAAAESEVCQGVAAHLKKIASWGIRNQVKRKSRLHYIGIVVVLSIVKKLQEIIINIFLL